VGCGGKRRALAGQDTHVFQNKISFEPWKDPRNRLKSPCSHAGALGKRSLLGLAKEGLKR